MAKNCFHWEVNFFYYSCKSQMRQERLMTELEGCTVPFCWSSSSSVTVIHVRRMITIRLFTNSLTLSRGCNCWFQINSSFSITHLLLTPAFLINALFKAIAQKGDWRYLEDPSRKAHEVGTLSLHMILQWVCNSFFNGCCWVTFPAMLPLRS